jgi:molybdopterin-binding protein
MTAQTVLPLVMFKVISEFTGLSWMRVISPHKWLRAEVLTWGSFSNSTDDDLTSALISMPMASPRVSAESRVMTATISFSVIEAEADLEIDVTFAQPDDWASELVAGAGLHRHPPEQPTELIEIAGLAVVHARAQGLERRLILRFERTIQRHDLAPVVSDLRTATVLAAGRALDQRLIGEVVHGVDGVPRRLVRKRHHLGGLRDRTVLVDRFEQADAGVTEKGAELGVDFEFAAQAMGVHQSRNVIGYTAKAAASLGVAKKPPKNGCSLWLCRSKKRSRVSATRHKALLRKVYSEVAIASSGGSTVYAVVTNEAALELGLKAGVPATALIKASHVVLDVPV